MHSPVPARLLLVALFAATLAACSGPSADDHLARADEFREQSLLQEAIIEYRNAIQIDPQRGDIRLKLADAYVEARDGGGALREYVRAADLLPDSLDAQLKAGSLLLLAGAFEDARSRANNALSLDPTSVDALILLANTKAGLKDLDGALDEYQEAATLNPNERVYAGMGAVQLARGELTDAEASFRKAVAAAPDSVAVQLALANFLWSSRRQDEAEQAFKAALAIDPANVLANRALGVFYIASNRAAEAEPHFQAIAAEVKTTEATIALADYYVMTRRFDESRKVLLDLARDEKAWAAATTRLAGVDAIEGFRAQGIGRARDVLERYPTDLPARLLLARLYLADGKREEALAEANTMVQQEPNAPIAGDAFMLIGQVHAMLDRPEAAIKAFESVLTRFPQPFAAELALASLHLSSGAVDKATTYVQQALALQPTHPMARAMKVRVLLVEGKTAEAQVELASLQKEFPDAPPVLNLLAAQQMAQGQPAAARETYLKAAARGANDLEPLAGLVQIALATGRTADAIGRIEEALKTGGANGDVLVLAARVYGAAGQWDRAEELLRKAIDLDPSRLRGYGLLAELYVRQDRLSEAERQFQAMVERNPTSVATNTMLGMLFDMRGKLEDAERQYEKTLALDPEAAVAANNLAYRLAEAERDLDRALQLAQTAQRRLPNEPNVADTLGWIYYRKGMTSAAIREFERSIEINPKDPLSRYHLGLAYNQAGQIEKARRTLTEALEMNANFPGADDARKTLAGLGR